MTGMVFGTFDGLHEGHKDLLRQARERCDRLVVVVAPDQAVAALKGRPPLRPAAQRRSDIAAFDPALEVVEGDAEQGSWAIFGRIKPDAVFLGYDQQALVPEMKKAGMPCFMLEPHHPERYKSSLLDER
ncbi:MAG: adenylyltransferase/cytidyltransferase family protein [Patescibacteria group bacterium]|nr:adenylyltransferase/cytidyltransferase family protein [Patescibacteria group bacterium]